ncbi:hypothetical protein [Streptomyces sp. CB02959]|uniref:hypothetical protein n=1 Tax=Streptomyces sp. CB02959 TaxID=2020330 RepID=UPI0011AF3B0E|nr:hypothetical protein [Streptomyces sp. CB02959]
MPSEDGSGASALPRVVNPLWIISLFLGLSETTAGVVAALASGWVQGALTLFAIVFPLLVSGAFFTVLWRKPEVLYAPGDFPEHVPVGTYVDGMRRGSRGQVELLEEVVRETLESVLPSFLSSKATPAEAMQLVNEAIESAHDGIASRVLTIDLSGVDQSFLQAQFPLFEGATVSDFLDRLWAMLRDHVKPYTYGTHWVLIDRKGGHVLRDIGTQWAKNNLGSADDERLLKDVGIHANSDLAAVLLR